MKQAKDIHQILLFDTTVGSTNLGDEIIWQSIMRYFQPLIDSKKTYRLATHLCNFYPSMTFLNATVKLKWMCKNADLKLIAGTNLLAGNFTSMVSQWMLPLNTKLYRESVLIGVGKTHNYKSFSKYTRSLYKKILSKDYIHSARDKDTKEAIESLGLQAVNTGCPTLWGFNDEFCRGIPTEKADRVVFSVSGYEAQRDCKADRELIRILRETYDQLYFWAQAYPDEGWLKELDSGDDIECIRSLTRYEQLLGEGNIDYVGTRLHGGIYAMQHQCRSLIVAIDARTMGIHETSHIPVIKRSDIGELEESINGSFDTDIVVDHKEVSGFLEQFGLDYEKGMR